mmetsp:Transcript_11883/g.34203  ORF Transcript_11883/g.34203 Transcript_11883/m.34203 type:complete len:109 (-) Transcript_11883:675-1001(-)
MIATLSLSVQIVPWDLLPAGPTLNIRAIEQFRWFPWRWRPMELCHRDVLLGPVWNTRASHANAPICLESAVFISFLRILRQPASLSFQCLLIRMFFIHESAMPSISNG